MNMDVIKSFTEQMQGFAAPLTRYNRCWPATSNS